MNVKKKGSDKPTRLKSASKYIHGGALSLPRLKRHTLIRLFSAGGCGSHAVSMQLPHDLPWRPPCLLFIGHSISANMQRGVFRQRTTYPNCSNRRHPHLSCQSPHSIASSPQAHEASNYSGQPWPIFVFSHVAVFHCYLLSFSATCTLA